MNISQAIQEIDASVQRHRNETLAILSRFANKNATTVNVERPVAFVGEIMTMHITPDGIAEFGVDTTDSEDERFWAEFSYNVDDDERITSVLVSRICTWGADGEDVRLSGDDAENLERQIMKWIEDHE